jgi:hypothetical protein
MRPPDEHVEPLPVVLEGTLVESLPAQDVLIDRPDEGWRSSAV